jgi:hypothetical protein
MATSIERDEGTSNADRIFSEIEQAVLNVEERFSGYRQLLAEVAMECYVLTAEHDEQRININQQYDELIKDMARELSRDASNGGEE